VLDRAARTIYAPCASYPRAEPVAVDYLTGRPGCGWRITSTRRAG